MIKNFFTENSKGWRNLIPIFLLAFLTGFSTRTTAQCTVEAQTSEVGASIRSSGENGICLFCRVTDEHHLTDRDPNNHAYIKITSGAWGTGYIDVRLGATHPSGTRAGFVAWQPDQYFKY